MGGSHITAAAGKRQRVSPHNDAYHFFNRNDADKEAQRKPHLEEAAMALLLLDVHSAPGKVTYPAFIRRPQAHREGSPVLRCSRSARYVCSRPAWPGLPHGSRRQCVTAAAPARDGSCLRPNV